MSQTPQKVESINLLVAITGASGAVYAERLLKKLESLSSQVERIGVIFSENGKAVWRHELSSDPLKIPFVHYANSDFFTPPASGSGHYNRMIIIPCTMGTMASIAQGLASDLIARAADVMLKERKILIIVSREMPLNLIQIRNMETITLAGGIICPATPSFYSLPQTMDEAVDTVVHKVLRLAGFQINDFSWGESSEP